MSDSKILKIRLIGDAAGAVGAIAKTDAATNTLGARMKSLSKSFKSVGSTFTSAGRTLTHSVTLPVVAAGAASVKMATDFNSAMTRVQTQAGGSAKDVQWLSKQILALGGKVQQTPVQLADAMYHLKSVGLSNADAMKALAASSHLAAVGNTDLEETTNAVAGAWRTGMKGATNFHGVVKTLNAVIGAGNMKMEDLNAAMGTGFLPAAKTFGLSLHDVGAALAVMTDEGVPANAAATRLRMSFSLLGAPSKAAEKVLKGIGLSADKLGHTLRNGGIVGAIGLLKDHLKGLSKVSQSQLLSHAFGGGRSSAAIMSLINNFDVLKKKEKQVGEGMGKFDSAVSKQAKTPQAQFKTLLSTLETLGIKLGNQLLPFVVKIANAFNKFFTWVQKLPSPIKKMAGIFTLVVAAAGPLLMIIGGIATGIGALLTPVGAIVAAVVALAAAFAYAWTHSKKFRDFMKGLWKDISGQLKEVWGLIQSQLIPAFKKIMPILMPIVKFIAGVFVSAIVGAIKGVIQVVKGVIQVISGVVSFIADLIHGKWSAAWHDLWNIIKGVFNIVVGALKVWWNAGILGIFKKGFVKLIESVLGGWKGILKLFKWGKDLLGKGVSKLWSIITWPFRKAFGWVKDFIVTGWKFIKGDFSNGVGGIKAILGRVLQVITWPYRTAFKLAFSIIKGAWNFIRSIFGWGIGLVRNALHNLPSTIKNIFSGAGSWLWNAGKSIIMGLIHGIESMVGWLKSKLSFVTDLIPKWKGPAEKDAKLLHPAGQLIMGGLVKGIQSKFGDVKSTLTGFTDNLAETGARGALAGAGGMAGGTYRGGYLRGSQGGSGPMVVVHVEGNVIGEKDFAKRVTPAIRTELVKIGKRNGRRYLD